MTLIQLAVIALIQGITEFLPISSSGHLVLIPSLTGWQDQGLVIDVAVHVGTLGAVMAYLWRDIWMMIAGILKPGNIRRNPGLRLIAQLVVGTIPLVIVGAVVYKYLGDTLRSAAVVGWATLGFGILLYLADRYTVTINRIEHMTWGRAFTIGVAQIFALIPGASRAGTTITMARWLGFERTDAARFSMLLSIPAILAAGSAATLDLIQSDAQHVLSDAIVAGAMAFVAALVAVVLMMSWLKRASLYAVRDLPRFSSASASWSGRIAKTSFVGRRRPTPPPATARLTQWGMILMGGREGEWAGAACTIRYARHPADSAEDRSGRSTRARWLLSRDRRGRENRRSPYCLSVTDEPGRA